MGEGTGIFCIPATTVFMSIGTSWKLQRGPSCQDKFDLSSKFKRNVENIRVQRNTVKFSEEVVEELNNTGEQLTKPSCSCNPF